MAVGAAMQLGSAVLAFKLYATGSNGLMPVGLINGKAPGQQCKLNDAQRTALAAIVESGPNPSVHDVVRWRLSDLRKWLEDTFGISLHETSISRELKALGYVKLTARPRHHAQDAAALEEFKKKGLQPQWQSSARASCRAR